MVTEVAYVTAVPIIEVMKLPEDDDFRVMLDGGNRPCSTKCLIDGDRVE